MPNKLSKKSEERMIAALEKVSDLMKEGSSPNDSLVKIATEMKIPAGHVRLMVNAINTGKTNAHRLSHDDIFEKAASFELADAEKVLQELYPDEVKTASDKARETVVDHQYTRPPEWARQIDPIKKSCINNPLDGFWMVSDQKEPEHCPEYGYKKAKAEIQRSTNIIIEKKAKLARVRNKAIAVVAGIREYFKQAGHIPYTQVLANSSIMFGKTAEAVLKGANINKQALAELSKQDIPVNINKAPYSLIKTAIDTAVMFKEAKEDLTTTEKTASDHAEKLMLPFVPGPETGRSVLGRQSSSFDTFTKTGFLGSAISGGFGLTAAMDIAKDVAKKLPGSKSTEDLQKSDLSGLIDPKHETEIRNIQSEAMLNDLMANDDVIRGYDPEEVVDAFNEVSQITPYAANKKAIMRDLMRKRLAGGAQSLDQFALSDALKGQESLRNLGSVNDSSLKALSAFGVLPGAQNTTSRSVLG